MEGAGVENEVNSTGTNKLDRELIRIDNCCISYFSLQIGIPFRASDTELQGLQSRGNK